jgi:hypothetical protein
VARTVEVRGPAMHYVLGVGDSCSNAHHALCSSHPDMPDLHAPHWIQPCLGMKIRLPASLG